MGDESLLVFHEVQETPRTPALVPIRMGLPQEARKV